MELRHVTSFCSAQEGFNPKTGETSSSLRSTIEEVSNVNLLRLAAKDGLFPPDDEETA
jgi:hypothetical protein